MLLFAAKSSLILIAALAITTLMRRSSAASRHVVWTCALLAVLLLPLASALLPVLPLPLLRPTVTETVLFDRIPRGARAAGLPAEDRSQPRI